MKLFLSAFLLMAMQVSNAGPLGTRMGMTIEEVGKIAILTPGQLNNITFNGRLIEPAGLLTDIQVVAPPGIGLCRFSISSIPIESPDGDGSEIRKEYNKLAILLMERYGQPSSTIERSHKGFFDPPVSAWMIDLHNKDRSHLAQWEKGPLPDDIASIKLEAGSYGRTRGFVSIRYDYTNTTNCSERLETIDSKRL